MRRVAAVFLAFAVFAPAWFAAVAPTPAQCAMACHANGAKPGAVCCRLGLDGGPVFKLCGESRDGVPLPPACTLSRPVVSETLTPPTFSGLAISLHAARPASLSPEPADPVPLRLS